MIKSEKKTFTIQYKVVGLYTASIRANNLKDALEQAEILSHKLHDIKGEILDEDFTITGVYQ